MEKLNSRKLWLVLAWELLLICILIFSKNFDGHFDWFLIASGGGVAFYCIINVAQKLKIDGVGEYESKTETANKPAVLTDDEIHLIWAEMQSALEKMQAEYKQAESKTEADNGEGK